MINNLKNPLSCMISCMMHFASSIIVNIFGGPQAVYLVEVFVGSSSRSWAWLLRQNSCVGLLDLELFSSQKYYL